MGLGAWGVEAGLASRQERYSRTGVRSRNSPHLPVPSQNERKALTFSYIFSRRLVPPLARILPDGRMIHAVLVINNFGKPRLLKFYTRTPEQQQQQIVRELFATLTARSTAASSFVDAARWFDGVPSARVVYRQYATLYFCMVIDSAESELGILDLVQVLVETLDRHFKNVCELDLVFNYPKVHYVVDEMIVGGLVVETNPSEILEQLDAQLAIEHRQSASGQAAIKAQQQLDALGGALSEALRQRDAPR